MNFLQTGQGKKTFTRIIIGQATTGKSGVKKPIRTISVEGISVKEMAELLKFAITERCIHGIQET